MTPGARIQAAIGILDEILAGTAAEKALTGWARASRFAGSKDRAAVRDHVYDVLRRRRSLAALGGGENGRALLIGLCRDDGLPLDDLFSGAGYAPAPLTEAERMAGRPPAAEGERLDLPDWLLPEMRASLGEALEAEAGALRHRAPVMLRVNLRKADRETAIAALSADGVCAQPHEIAETALVVTDGARRVAQGAAYRGGLVELQDGASQAAVEALPLCRGMKVLDYCAGGGGKLLAMAGRCDARFHAYDAVPARLRDLPDRAARAGVEARILRAEECRGEAPFDLVFCDVPCSGSGSWRRDPEGKWRLTPDRLSELTRVQDAILSEAAELVAPGGVLVYATCSLLREENDARITAFTDARPRWHQTFSRQWRLEDGGDGFFTAHMTR
ncbi:16S rRNA (cytosine967-C5)-methyltransferase [Salinihabitans flavidus]|uniref:16S rRNA (Cytosine967-C5)-methyltransferase n=1 Tax=Salinihabitans flavidus TaxID=569882 RepID=A0A1H8VB48_9RHOB|nr:RsmB/NOP family class I SAM-dependent RNA methyltransferase [Salinihabitans flavidus]SEP12659.1 16S rRNA (cytosine967-C5)-methyltransferase [Salinihabitans flavidus]